MPERRPVVDPDLLEPAGRPQQFGEGGAGESDQMGARMMAADRLEWAERLDHVAERAVTNRQDLHAALCCEPRRPRASS